MQVVRLKICQNEGLSRRRLEGLSVYQYQSSYQLFRPPWKIERERERETWVFDVEDFDLYCFALLCSCWFEFEFLMRSIKGHKLKHVLVELGKKRQSYLLCFPLIFVCVSSTLSTFISYNTPPILINLSFKDLPYPPLFSLSLYSLCHLLQVSLLGYFSQISILRDKKKFDLIKHSCQCFCFLVYLG